MRVAVFFCFLFLEYLWTSPSLYEKCKAEATNGAVCQTDTITSLIQEKTNQLMRIQKDIWETTEEFTTRKQNLENEYEQKIIQAIKEETSISGIGKATFLSYDADTQTIELALSWNEKIKAIFDSKALPTKIKTMFKREAGKRLFGSQKTIDFDITPQYNAHQLEIAEIFISDGEQKHPLNNNPKHPLNNNPKTIYKWLTPTNTTCTTNGGKIYSDGICKASWEKAEAICSASGGRLPSIEELKEVVTECGGKIDDYSNLANSSYQSCYKTKGFTSDYYWSGSPYVSDTSKAWNVFFLYGDDGWRSKSDTNLVRCVRDSQ